MERKTEAEDVETSPPAKKPYKAPALISWGTLKDITLGSGSGHNDGMRNRGKT